MSIFETHAKLETTFNKVSKSSGDKKKPRKRSEIPASHYKRLMNEAPPERDTYVRRGVNIGSVGKLGNQEEMEKYILEFWNPKAEELSYTSEKYLGSGTVTGDMVARRLHERGATYQSAQGDEVHEEMFVEFPDGRRGFIDLVLDIDFMKVEGAKTKKSKLEPIRIKQYRVTEVKETSSTNYSAWVYQEDLPIHYRSQFSQYAKWLHEKGISKDTKGQFLIISRDNPNNVKTIDVECEPDLCEKAALYTEKFWNHIFNMTSPLGKVNKTYVYEAIYNQPERLFGSKDNKGRWGRARDFVLDVMRSADYAEFVLEKEKDMSDGCCGNSGNDQCCSNKDAYVQDPTTDCGNDPATCDKGSDCCQNEKS